MLYFEDEASSRLHMATFSSLAYDWVTKSMGAHSVGTQSIGEVVHYYQILGRLRALTSSMTKYNQKPLNNITLQ